MDDFTPPATKEEALARGWTPATKEEIAKAKVLPNLVVAGAHTLGSICYQGPCNDGSRTICYRTDTGCDDCFSSSEGC